MKELQDQILINYMREKPGGVTVREIARNNALGINSPTKVLSNINRETPLTKEWDKNPNTGKRFKRYYLDHKKGEST